MCVAKEEALFEKIAQYRRVRFGYTITMELLHVMGCIVVDGSVRKKSAFLSMHTFFFVFLGTRRDYFSKSSSSLPSLLGLINSSHAIISEF